MSDPVDQIRRARESWQQRHRDQLANQRKPGFRTSSGREVGVFYAPDDLEGSDYLKELGLPGDFPYTRGETATGYRGELWHWEFYAGFGSAEDANERFRYLIEQGSTGGVSIALDLPTQVGLDSDHQLALRDVGRVGVALDGLNDVLRMFEGIDLEAVGRIFTTANAIGPIACAWFICLAEEHGLDPRKIVVTTQNDPLKEYVARGTQFLPVGPAADLACDVVEYCARNDLPWLPISVSGSHMKQAGGTCAQEAGFTIANAIAYCDKLKQRGLTDFSHLVELHFCTDMDFFEEIAKYRVVRRVWSEILRDRYGIEGVAPRIHAATSGLPLTAQQPKNNIVRIALQCLAQVLGGVSQTRTASYDEALAIPAEDAVKLSIRTNQIIGYETGIPDTVDPLGGSYYLETLTREMYDEVKQILAKVEEIGGAERAVESGYFASELADGAYRQERELQDGERVIVGVNRFVEEDSEQMKLFELDPEVGERQRQRLAEAKASRSSDAVNEALEAVRNAAAKGENSVPAVIEAVRAGATVGEISDVWRSVYGEFRAESRRFS